MSKKTMMADPARRALFQWGAVLAAGVLLPACGGSDEASEIPGTTTDTLPEPQILHAQDGVLEMHIHVKYAQMNAQLPPDGIANCDRYPVATSQRVLELRSFNGRYIAPTLILNPGDTLRMWVHNELPPSPQTSAWEGLNFQNSTNMHFHGLHVDPREIRPGVFGDYVVDDATGGIQPGQSRFHEITLPEHHACGIFWYHPHLHGSTNAQVSSGMFGAILVQHPKNRWQAPRQMVERTIFAHKLTVTEQGRVDTLEDSFASASAFLLNGVHQPTLVMRPGEVQHWHLLNPTSFYPIYPVLEGHDLHVHARDGNDFDGFYEVMNEARIGRTNRDFLADWPGGRIYPGGRLSMFVTASMTPGEYWLKSARCQSWHKRSQQDLEFEEVIARIVVEGEPVTMAVPDASVFRHAPDYASITDEELASCGGIQRSLHLAILNQDSNLLHAKPEGESWALQVGSNIPSVFAVGSGSDGAGVLGSFAPYHSSVAQCQTVDFGAVEEWTIWNHDGYPHPFHIHVNDCCVVAVNGEKLQKPFWADTLSIPPSQDGRSGSLTFRSRFKDFYGKFVWHCHALDHEDLGMMQMVEILPPQS